MLYKIAVASSDGSSIDLSFGAARWFDIYEVNKTTYQFLERRIYTVPEKNGEDDVTCFTCMEGKNCGTGEGCAGTGEAWNKVLLISDCRSIVCKKIGFNVMKQLEKRAISGFDVECGVEEALTKITYYLNKVDEHKSLRGLAREEY